jgi:hypothetical protein
MRRDCATAAMPDCAHPRELTAGQIFKHAVRFGVQARITKSDYLRVTYNRLALRYAILAAEREIEEAGAGRR